MDFIKPRARRLVAPHKQSPVREICATPSAEGMFGLRRPTGNGGS